MDRGCSLFDGQSQRLGDADPDRLAGEIDADRPLASEQPGLRQDPEHEISIGVGGFVSSSAVAGGPRHSLRGFGTNAQVAAAVDPRDRTAAGADRLHFQRRHVDGKLVHDRLRGAHRLPVDDDAGEKCRATDVCRDDVAVTEPLGEANAADHSAGQHAADRGYGSRRGLARCDRSAGTLHHQERAAQTLAPQLRLQLGQVEIQARPDLRAHDRGRVASELPDARADLRRDRYKDVGILLGHKLAQPMLVLGVSERPEQGDGDRADALGQDLADHCARVVLVERGNHHAGAIDALRHLAREPVRHDRARLILQNDLLQLMLRAAEIPPLDVHDVDRVAMALGGDKTDIGHVAHHERVQRRGRTMGDIVRVAQQLLR